jgi:hypothetical protein
METIERLRYIVENGKVTAEDKKLIADLSIKYGLEFKPKCKDCYVDQAFLVYKAMEGDESHGCSARLRDDIDVIIHGRRINNATLTDELVEKYRGNALPEHWFV